MSEKQTQRDFQPQWKNKHAETCAVTQEREALWGEFVEDPANASSELIGALREYDHGGDQEVENCTCGKYRKPTATVLSVQARALAQHIDAFVDLVARDTNTHDGEPRGQEWEEVIGSGYFKAEDIREGAMALRELADLWDFG